MITQNLDRRRFIALLGATALTGCSHRGAFVDATPSQTDRENRSILYATNRAEDTTAPSAVGRRQDVRLALLDITTPVGRAPGELDFSGPRSFALSNSTPVHPSDFSTALNRSTAPDGSGRERLMLWVHGFNTTPAEALYRQVQIVQDIDHAGPAVSFVWPSAGRVSGYIHDRDSALHARGALADFLLSLRAAWSGEIVAIAHSLGAFLTLEALGRLHVAGRNKSVIDSLMLVQPDIAPDVFETQVRIARPLPQRTALIVSQDDPVLRLSARLSGQPERVGASGNREHYEALGLTVIDLSGVSDATDPHLIPFSSPTVLALLRRFVAGDRPEN